MKQDPFRSSDKDQELEAFCMAVRLTRPLLRHITATVDAGARAHGVTVGQRAVLEALYEGGPMSGPQLVAALALKRQFVFRMLGETDSAGLTVRQPNPKRARAYIHLLTEKGRMAISAIRDAERATLRDFISRQNPREIAIWSKLQASLTAFFASRDQEHQPTKRSS